MQNPRSPKRTSRGMTHLVLDVKALLRLKCRSCSKASLYISIRTYCITNSIVARGAADLIPGQSHQGMSTWPPITHRDSVHCFDFGVRCPSAEIVSEDIPTDLMMRGICPLTNDSPLSGSHFYLFLERWFEKACRLNDNNIQLAKMIDPNW